MTYRGATSQAGGSGTNAISIPAGTQAGDLLIIALSYFTGQTVFAPSGFSLAASASGAQGSFGSSLAVYTKAATSADLTAGSFSVGANNLWAAQMRAYGDATLGTTANAASYTPAAVTGTGTQVTLFGVFTNSSPYALTLGSGASNQVTYTNPTSGWAAVAGEDSATPMSGGVLGTVTAGSPSYCNASLLLTSPATTISPSGIASPPGVGAPTLTGAAATISPAGIARTPALGTPTLTGTSATISPSSIAHPAAVGTPTISGAGSTLHPTGISSTPTVGTPSISSTVAPRDLLNERWATGNLVGTAKHALIVRLRPGKMHRAYQDATRIDNGVPILVPYMWKGQNHHPWQGLWTPLGDWVELPNIESEQHARDFDPQTGGQQGVGTCTVVMENIGFPQADGVGGIYHLVERGYYSPERGAVPTGRSSEWADIANEWAQTLNSGWQIEIWEGYGQGTDVQLRSTLVDHSYAPASGALHRTWTGIVVDMDRDSRPDKITLTASDFGVFLTDQRLIGDNKAPDIKSPVTFADRRKAQGETKIETPINVSTEIGSRLTFDDPNWVWQSGPFTSATNYPWMEIVMTAGYYTDLYFAPMFDGMEVWVSLYMNGTGGVMDSTHPQPSGWVDLGLGSTPTGGDSVPFIRHMASVAQHPSQRWGLTHGFDVPDGSRLRLTFGNLVTATGGYRAGTNAFATYRYGDGSGSYPNAGQGWVLVEDAIDVVRVMFIWAGFKEWHLEAFGWSLYQQMVFGGDVFMIDVINDILQQGNFIFWMGPPTDDDRSIGVPHCEHASAIDAPPGGMLELHDDQHLEAVQDKWDLSTLPYVMRYRGAVSKNGQALLSEGVTGPLRYMATYYPPWAGADYVSLGDYVYSSGTQIRRTAAILRHFTETMGDTVFAALTSNEECLLACVLAAFQYALSMWTGTVQIAGRTRIDLNDQLGVNERASAINSRMWVTSIQSQHDMGPNGKWVMTVGGAFIDTAEMASVIADYEYVLPLAEIRRNGF